MSVLSLHVVIKFINANAVYLSVSVFTCAIAHCVRIPMLNMFISDGLSPPLGLCLLSGVPDYFYRNKISSGGDLSHYSSASLY